MATLTFLTKYQFLMTKSVIQYFMGHLNGILNSISRKRPFLFHEQAH